jgi:hypothetical protein
MHHERRAWLSGTERSVAVLIPHGNVIWCMAVGEMSEFNRCEEWMIPYEWPEYNLPLQHKS